MGVLRVCNMASGSGASIDNEKAIAAYKEIIEDELSLDIIDYGDKPCLRALHVVARSGDIETGRELLERHADPNFCTSKGLSPLHYAVISGSPPMIRLLLVYGAQVNKQSPRDGKTPLYTAVEKGELDCARVLLQYGANPNMQAHCGTYPKEVAFGRGDVDFIKLLSDFENLQTSQKQPTPPTNDLDSYGNTIFKLCNYKSEVLKKSRGLSTLSEEQEEAPPSYEEATQGLFQCTEATSLDPFEYKEANLLGSFKSNPLGSLEYTKPTELGLFEYKESTQLRSFECKPIMGNPSSEVMTNKSKSSPGKRPNLVSPTNPTLHNDSPHVPNFHGETPYSDPAHVETFHGDTEIGDDQDDDDEEDDTTALLPS